MEQFFNQEPEQSVMATTSILSLFETTRSQRASFVEDVINKLQDEQVDPLKVHLQLKCIEDIINSLTCTDEKKNKTPWFAATYKRLLLDAAEKNGKKFQYQNAEFSIKEVGSTYDYSKCEDPELLELMAEQEVIKEKIKKKQDFLKTLPISGMVITNEETGETYKAFPPSKSSTTSVSVSLK